MIAQNSTGLDFQAFFWCLLCPLQQLCRGIGGDGGHGGCKYHGCDATSFSSGGNGSPGGNGGDRGHGRNGAGSGRGGNINLFINLEDIEGHGHHKEVFILP